MGVTMASRVIVFSCTLLLATHPPIVLAEAEVSAEGRCTPAQIGYWQHSVMSPEVRIGVWPGISIRLAEAILNERKLKFEQSRDPGDYFERAIIVGDTEDMSVFLIRKGRVEAIFEYVDSTLDGRTAADVVADYRSYLCWRFGATATRSNLEPRVRAEILGPVLVHDLVSAADVDVAVDVFRVEDPRKDGDQSVGVVFSAPRRASSASR